MAYLSVERVDCVGGTGYSMSVLRIGVNVVALALFVLGNGRQLAMKSDLLRRRYV